MGLVIVFAFGIALACLGVGSFSIYKIFTSGLSLWQFLWIGLLALSCVFGFHSTRLMAEVFYPIEVSNYRLDKYPEKQVFLDSFALEEAQITWKDDASDVNCNSVSVKVDKSDPTRIFSEDDKTDDWYSGFKVVCFERELLVVNKYERPQHVLMFEKGIGDQEYSEPVTLPDLMAYDEWLELTDEKKDLRKNRINEISLLTPDEILIQFNYYKKSYNNLGVVNLKTKELQIFDVPDHFSKRYNGEYLNFRVKRSPSGKVFVLVYQKGLNYDRNVSRGRSLPALSTIFGYDQGEFKKIMSLSLKIGHIDRWQVTEQGVEFEALDDRDQDQPKTRSFRLVPKGSE